jgi:two-component system chemotaxis sensor kinase CheA
MMDELLEQFVIEGRELVEQASSDLIALDRGPPDASRIERVFRVIHTLKGSVALFDLAPMGRMLHVAEDLLGTLRSEKVVAVHAVVIDALWQCVDASERWIEAIAQTGGLPAGADAAAREITTRLATVAKAPPQADPPTDVLTDARWVVGEAGDAGGGGVSIRYEPRPDCLLNGDDPLLLVRTIPELLALRVTPRDPWIPQQFDPYCCNLIIEAVSGAPVGEVREVFRHVADEVVLVERAPGAGPSDAESASSPDGVSDVSSRGVRVEASQIDSLVDLAGELVIAKNNLGHLLEGVATTGSSMSHPLAASLADFERLTGELHRNVMRMRLVPLARTFNRFPRWMRETAGKLKKAVHFDVVDNGAEADRAIVDGLYEPLLHVLRNALDHGIEDASCRQMTGKPATGRISLEARPQGDQIAIVVQDDGAGLNLSHIREIARSKGMIAAEAIDALDDAGVADLTFMPGFSTAKSVTDMSGRGVGMGAVRAAIGALGGRVSISTRADEGTTVEMTVPQAVLLSTVVTVAVGDERFGVPIEYVAETCRVPHDRILPIRSGEAFVLRHRTLSLLRLCDLLQLPATQRSTESKVLVVNAGKEQIGIEVDHVGERLDVLMRPMTGLLSGMPGVLGTSLLGDGRVLLVLDLPELTV